MRTLSFLVNEQKISKDPKCDFSNIFPDTKGYLQAKSVLGEDGRTAKLPHLFGVWVKNIQLL